MQSFFWHGFPFLLLIPDYLSLPYHSPLSLIVASDLKYNQAENTRDNK